MRTTSLVRPAALTALILSTAWLQPGAAQGPARAVAQGQARPAIPSRDTAAQPAATGTASITGTVVVAGSGQAARRARVTVSGTEVRGSRSANTDEQGRFAFTALPAGRYMLNASKPGHVAVSYGQRVPGAGRPGTPIQLGDGEKFEARLQIPRGGVITGTILDEHTEATPGTMVRVMRYVVQGGQRTLQMAGNGSTDDRGMYRVFGLQPGDYAVCATPRNVANVVGNLEAMRSELDALRREAGAVERIDAVQAQTLLQRAASMQAIMLEAGDQQAGYAPVCYPGTTSPGSAGTIALGVGEERANVDFQLQLVPVGTIEGMVTGPAGTTPQNLQVMLVNTAIDLPGLGSTSARPSGDGRFRIPNVAPGQYKLIARGMSEGGMRGRGGRGAGASGMGDPLRVEATRLWAVLDLPFDGTSISNVMLAMQPGMSVSGQIAFDGALTRPADLSRLRVSMAPVGGPGTPRELGGPVTGRVDAAGKFTITGVVPGSYRLTATGAGMGWFLESAVVGGQDSLDFPFEVKPNQNIGNAAITFGDQASELSGTLLDDRGGPVTDYTVIVFPADEKFWTPNTRRVATARPGTDGRFTLRTLPPGDYRLATVLDPEPNAWTDPEYLRQLEPVSMSVRLAPGEKKVQNVRLSVPQNP